MCTFANQMGTLTVHPIHGILSDDRYIKIKNNIWRKTHMRKFEAQPMINISSHIVVL